MVYRWTGASPGCGAAGASDPGAAEQTLIKGLRQGDNDAYTALYDLYGPRILSFVTRILGNPDDAHDVTQEVFLKAFRRLPDDSRELALKSWLYKVASTTTLDHLRARGRRGTTSNVACEDMPSTRDGFEQAEMNGLMQAALDQLSDRHRLVLVLKDLHGLRHDEIARILGVSRGATETLLFRARAAFRQAYLAAHDGDREEPGVEKAPACPRARQTTLALSDQGTSPEERRRLLDHARTCRDCRRAIRRSRGAGLGAFLLAPWAAAHAWLRPTGLLTRLTSSTTATPGDGAGAGGGLFGALAETVGAKVAVVAAAATVTVSLPAALVTPRHEPVKQAAAGATASAGLSAHAGGKHTGAIAFADGAGDNGSPATGDGEPQPAGDELTAPAVDDELAGAIATIDDPDAASLGEGTPDDTVDEAAEAGASATGDGDATADGQDGDDPLATTPESPGDTAAGDTSAGDAAAGDMSAGDAAAGDTAAGETSAVDTAAGV